MKVYSLYIKSHCEAPDFEAEIEAENEDDAVKRFEMMLKGEFDQKFIREHMGEEL